MSGLSDKPNDEAEDWFLVSPSEYAAMDAVVKAAHNVVNADLSVYDDVPNAQGLMDDLDKAVDGWLEAIDVN